MPRQQSINDELMNQVGARIRFIRLEAGLSLRKLAQKAKSTSDRIMLIELGRSAISSQMLRKIARGLNVRPFDLLNLDTQNDDLGYLIESMRQDPKATIRIKALAKQYAMAGGDSSRKVD